MQMSHICIPKQGRIHALDIRNVKRLPPQGGPDGNEVRYENNRDGDLPFRSIILQFESCNSPRNQLNRLFLNTKTVCVCVCEGGKCMREDL